MATISSPSRRDAWRFLTQATFGPTVREVDEFVAAGAYQPWLDRQFKTMPRLRTVDILDQSLAHHNKVVGGGAVRNAGWVAGAVWEQFLSGPDQLRQRVAFALSEIMVVSLNSDDLHVRCTAVAAYHDMLLAHAFGNFRTLIESVCRHPAMGLYLSHLGNPGPSQNDERIPDQNFARELMQLFTIGLVPLAMDGTVAVPGAETYTQHDIEVMSYVFTGWGWRGIDWFRDPVDNTNNLQAQIQPLKDWDHLEPAYSVTNEYKVWPMHATLADYRRQFVPDAPDSALAKLKIPLLGKTFTPDGTCEGDMKAALDILLSHPNVAPFIARQMIQRLVTSNPSPAYVRRVAEAFKAAGLSLQALVQAILIDPEARDEAQAQAPAFGKLREPVLRMSAALRAFGFRVFENAGRPIYAVGLTQLSHSPSRLCNLGQGPYQAPSVFNFFRPAYVAPGSKMQAQALVAPELQTCTETDAAAYVRFMQLTLTDGFGLEVDRPPLVRYAGVEGRVRAAGSIEFDLSEPVALARDKAWPALLQWLDERLLGGGMSAGLKQHIQGMLATPSDGLGAGELALKRVQLATLLIVVSPEFVVQR